MRYENLLTVSAPGKDGGQSSYDTETSTPIPNFLTAATAVRKSAATESTAAASSAAGDESGADGQKAAKGARRGRKPKTSTEATPTQTRTGTAAGAEDYTAGDEEKPFNLTDRKTISQGGSEARAARRAAADAAAVGSSPAFTTSPATSTMASFSLGHAAAHLQGAHPMSLPGMPVTAAQPGTRA